MKLRRASYCSPAAQGKGGFEDLECFRLALDVIVNAHDLARVLPADEKFDLAGQIRQSSKSVTANIAEGYGRFHYLDSLKFYSNARGSLNETLAHLINAKVLDYCEEGFFTEFYNLIRQTERALNGYMNYVRKQKAGEAPYGSMEVKEEQAPYNLDVGEPSP